MRVGILEVAAELIARALNVLKAEEISVLSSTTSSYGNIALVVAHATKLPEECERERGALHSLKPIKLYLRTEAYGDQRIDRLESIILNDPTLVHHAV